jgi:multiple sugar transport system permease protein
MTTRTRRLKLTLAYIVMAVALVWTFFPIYCALVLSIKQPGDFFTSKYIPFLQFRPTLENWLWEWQARGEPAGLGYGILNSVIVASLATALTLVLGVLSAYGLRNAGVGRRWAWALLILFLLPRFVPSAVLILPYAEGIHRLGLGDTLPPIVVAHTTLALPLVVLFMFSGMTEIPDEILDAARLDGCGEVDVLGRVVVPLMSPMLGAAAVLCLAASWSEFLFALINAEQHMRTAPLAVASLMTKDGIQFQWVGSHLVLLLVPPMLLALGARRFVVRAMSFGLVRE